MPPCTHPVSWSRPASLRRPGGVYAADFTAGTVRRIRGPGSVSALARLPQVTSVASAGSALYAVTLDGGLARISSGGVVPIAVAGGLDRPHGIAVDRDGSLLIAEDSRRVRRIDPLDGSSDARRRQRGHQQDRG